MIPAWPGWGVLSGSLGLAFTPSFPVPPPGQGTLGWLSLSLPPGKEASVGRWTSCAPRGVGCGRGHVSLLGIGVCWRGHSPSPSLCPSPSPSVCPPVQPPTRAFIPFPVGPPPSVHVPAHWRAHPPSSHAPPDAATHPPTHPGAGSPIRLTQLPVHPAVLLSVHTD